MLTKSQVKYIQSLKEKKFRTEEGSFVGEGPRLINELLASPNIEPVALYATQEWWMQNENLKNTVPFLESYEVSVPELERISFLTTPHQVLGVFKQPVFPSNPSFNGAISLLLDGIQDPGNLGTIIRIADWFGIKHIIARRDSADVFNPKVIQSTMGSISRVNVLYDDLITFIKEHMNIPVYASTLDGKMVSELGKVNEGLLLIGNESKGINEALVQLASHKVTIPKRGGAESLNAAVATGIILSHLV